MVSHNVASLNQLLHLKIQLLILKIQLLHLKIQLLFLRSQLLFSKSQLLPLQIQLFSLKQINLTLEQIAHFFVVDQTVHTGQVILHQQVKIVHVHFMDVNLKLHLKHVLKPTAKVQQTIQILKLNLLAKYCSAHQKYYQIHKYSKSM